jgi:hypothetical protein
MASFLAGVGVGVDAGVGAGAGAAGGTVLEMASTWWAAESCRGLTRQRGVSCIGWAWGPSSGQSLLAGGAQQVWAQAVRLPVSGSVARPGEVQ